MQSMGRWIHRHPTSTIPVGPKFRKLVEFLGCSWGTCDVMVHWFRCSPKPTWKVSHIQSTYIKQGLRTFICGGWADGSTIIPLPPFLMVLSLGVSGILGLQPAGLHMMVTPWLQMMSWCIGWHPRPKWKASHIQIKYMQAVWDHSYAVAGHMDPPSSHFHHSCWCWV